MSLPHLRSILKPREVKALKGSQLPEPLRERTGTTWLPQPTLRGLLRDLLPRGPPTSSKGPGCPASCAKREAFLKGREGWGWEEIGVMKIL